MSEPKLTPTTIEGEAVEQTETQKLMSLKKDELVQMILDQDVKYKKLHTRTQNLKGNIDGLQKDLDEAVDALAEAQEARELTDTEAANMSESLRIKNRQLGEVVDATLNLINVFTAVSDQTLKIFEYNGLINPRGGK